MDDVSKIERILNMFKEVAESRTFLDRSFVYRKLTRFDSSYEKGEIRKYFDDWIKYYANIDDINVHISNVDTDFCYFDSVKSGNLEKKYKMYIPMKADKIFENAKILFDFLCSKKIAHNSKIAIDVRCDDLVIRLFDIMDAKAISEFILNNETLRNGLLEKNDMISNPFMFHDNLFSFSMDGSESYNMILATYITMYISELKANNKLDDVSYLGFVNYVKNIYEKVYVSGKNIDKYLLQMRIFENEKDRLIDYELVTSMLLLAMTSKDKSFEMFNSYYEEMSSPLRRELIAQKIDDLLVNKREDDLSDTIEFEKIDMNKR